MARHLTISYQDLQLLTGISDKELKTIQQRAKRHSWPNVADPKDKRQTLLLFSGLPVDIKDRLPGSGDLERVIAELKEKAKADQKAAQVGTEALHLERQLAQMVEGSYMRHISYYADHYPSDNEKARTLAKEHALRLSVVTLQAGHSIKTELHPAYLCLSQKSTVGNYTKFSQAIKEWANGVNLVHGHKGTSRPERYKLTATVVAVIEEQYKHPNQYSSPIITDTVNRYCKEKGLPTVSDRTVRLYLERPDVRNRLLLFRNKAEFRKKVQATTRRQKALYAGDLYYMDGSPLQISCACPKTGKEIRPTLFVVMDQHSGEITGFSMTPGGEDRLVWIAAMKMACDLKRALPAEWVYDNASATGTEEFKALKDGLERMGCLLNPAKKGNPQAKADIERWFDTFQNKYQRLVDGFIGEGILSRRANGRIDAEWLQKVKRVNGLMSYDTLAQLVAEMIAAYNQTRQARRAAPSVAYAESVKPNMIAVSVEKLATLFWKSKTIKVANAEVKMTVRSTEYYYEVYDNAMSLALAGQQVKVYYDEADLSTVHIFALEGEYLAELRQRTLIIAATVNRQAGDGDQIYKQTSHNKAIKTIAARQSKEVVLAGGDALLTILNPLQAIKDDFNNAETAMFKNYLADAGAYDMANVEAYAAVEQDAIAPKNADYSTRYRKPATLEVVGEQPR